MVVVAAIVVVVVVVVVDTIKSKSIPYEMKKMATVILRVTFIFVNH